MGRLSFGAGALELLRPFLGPIYAWAAATEDLATAVNPWAKQLLFSWIAERLRGGGQMEEILVMRESDDPPPSWGREG